MISTFSPNCTFPDHSVNYVGSPPLRSTLGIVWPCVTALIASIYTALHLDVIVVRSETATGKCGCNWCSRLFDRACRKIRAPLVGLSIATIALFAPELVAQRSMMEWWWCKSALNEVKKIKNMSDEAKSQWTRTHCYYMNMGGFRLRCRGSLARHAHSPGTLCNCEEISLDHEVILSAIDCGMLPPEPPITEEEILDKSKASIFARLVAIWQIVWFIIDVVTRLVRGRPIAQLEVGVTGLAMLAVVTLCCYLDKPKGVNVATRISFEILPDHKSLFARILSNDYACGHAITPASRERDTERNYLNAWKRLDLLDYTNTSRGQSFVKEVMAHLSVGISRWQVREEKMEKTLVFAAAFALPFGAVHVAAWNAEFPTVADQWLWRISALVSMVVLLLMVIVWVSLSLRIEFDILSPDIWNPTATNAVYWFSLICYMFARGILIVEMVRCMLFLPPEAYVTSWTTNVPHFG